MKLDCISRGDGWPEVQMWEENERIKLERLKQQRSRVDFGYIEMEKMKEVVEQYSHIIQELESRNCVLVS
jgi:hypothetical protein